MYIMTVDERGVPEDSTVQQVENQVRLTSRDTTLEFRWESPWFPSTDREVMWQQLAATIALRDKVGDSVPVFVMRLGETGYVPDEPQTILKELMLDLEFELAEE